MCRVVKLSSLDRKSKDFVNSFGGDGIVRDKVDNLVQPEKREREQNEYWEQFVERTFEQVEFEQEGGFSW